MLKVLIADDHEIVRRGIRQILQDEFPFAHIDEAVDAVSLINMAISNDWNIIVSDLAMPGGGGFYVLEQLSKNATQIPVLILSIYPEEQYAWRVIKAGAAGYLNKDAAPEELVIAVRRVLTGRRYIADKVAEQLITTVQQPADKLIHELLSERELAVFYLVVSGMPVAKIAAQLSLRTTTVSTYRTRVLGKMNARSNAELIQYAIEHNLI